MAALSVKNMTLGAPLHRPPDQTPGWNEKRKYHYGVRQTHYNMLLPAQKMQPYWGATVIDGYEGREGNGPRAVAAVQEKYRLHRDIERQLQRMGPMTDLPPMLG